MFECNECLDDEIEQMRSEGIEKFDIGIFVEVRVEFVHSKISLRPLLNGLHNFDKMNLEFGTIANTKFGSMLKAKLGRMSDRIQLRADALNGRRVEKVVTRDKRAIEFIGNLISKAFGNAGPEDMRKIYANFVAMKRAIEKQRENSVLLHNDIDKERHDIEQQNVVLKQISVELFRGDNRLDVVQNEMLELQRYFELETMSEAIEYILESLSDIKRDGKMGRCNIKGLNPDFLIENLRQIESNKLGIAPVFASWEWEKYYQHEMCSIALHKDDLWVTLRIPIIRPNEKMYRTLPSSSHTWIRHELDMFGIDASFFKDQNHEIFSVIPNSILELCNVLGTTRVCNMRKTTYRELYQFIVPVELSNERILIMSNYTMNETLVMTTSCGGKNADLRTESWTIMRIPENCEVKNKNMIISIQEKSDSVSGNIELETVTKIEYKKVASKSKERKPIETDRNSLESAESADLEAKEFNANDDSTMNELDKLDLNHEGILSEFRAVKIGGLTSTICIAVMIVGILLALARHKCKKNKAESNGVNVNVNLERNDDTEKLPQNAQQEIGQQNSFMNEIEPQNKSINQFK